jgi:FkbM family methyltransferase
MLFGRSGRRARNRFSHAQSLVRLSQSGFRPQTIYDIGAYRGSWSRMVKRIFPGAECILFEANADNAAELKATGLPHFVVALAAEDVPARSFYLPTGVIATGASFYREATDAYADRAVRVQHVATRRLDGFIAEHRLPPPDLIKIDVQGAELDVLSGTGAALAGCSALIVEVSLLPYNEGAPLIADVVGGIDRLGFRCVDICEIHRLRDQTVVQLDLLFANAALAQRLASDAGLLRAPIDRAS